MEFFLALNSPDTPANDLRLRRPSIPDFIHYILILGKEPVCSFSMLSAKQGHYWYYKSHYGGNTLIQKLP